MTALSSSEWELLREAFDAEYYVAQCPERGDSDKDPFLHYMTAGWRECRDPSPAFKTLDYLLEHREILRSGANPFIAWVLGEEAAMAKVSHLNPHSADLAVTNRASRGNRSSSSDEANENTPHAEHGGTRWDTAAIPLASAVPAGCETLSKGEIERVRDAFDAEYYLQEYADVASAGVDPFQHFMSAGWRDFRDPSSTFSTRFYLSSYPDIAAAGVNPFVHWVLHGQHEKRSAISFPQRLALKSYAPTVSAIIPNYNHAPYLAQRIDSILEQTYPHIEITILDDCSTDNSREIIESYVARYPDRIRAIFNTENSAGVFRQWRKGIDETAGELVWICESDDFCEPDFVEKLVPYFRDDSVQIAFGRIQITDSAGEPNDFLDKYRESSEEGIWESPLVRPAAAWFANGFGVRNVIANVGGSIWRRGLIAGSAWEEACTYKVVGDWFLYSRIASGGQIAWEPAAVSYFRNHGGNTSSKAQRTPQFYAELESLMMSLLTLWDIPAETVRRFHKWISEQYDWFDVQRQHGPLEKYCNLSKLLGTRRRQPHILIAMQGFTPGGGEYFPINLANALLERGWIVSVIIFDSSDVNVHVRSALNPAVSVYDASWVVDYGADRFLADAGISLIHSHMISAESYFFRTWRIQTHVPYLVTLHGSYEAADIPLELLGTIVSPVDHFVYTADKNLTPLVELGIPNSRFTKLANAMPVDPAPFPKTRAEMGIDESAVVFTLVARGIKRKGWRAAIEAFILCRDRHPDQPMHLCLVGDGDEPDRHEKVHGEDRDITFLGYQSQITGLYRLSDVAVVPTRFAGESYPLCIIQALQVGTPVVASDVGEIRNMIERQDGLTGGLIVEALRDTRRFIAAFADAMGRMLDSSLRKRLSRNAEILGSEYDMGKLADQYGEIYDRMIGSGASSPISTSAQGTVARRLSRG